MDRQYLQLDSHVRVAIAIYVIYNKNHIFNVYINACNDIKVNIGYIFFFRLFQCDVFDGTFALMRNLRGRSATYNLYP